MKKTFLFLTMTLLFFIGSGAFNDTKAQTQLTRHFIDPYNCISISQQYYTNDQIGHDGSGNITSMTFNVVNIKKNDNTDVDLSEGIERTIEVWIQNADANSSFDENKMVEYNEKSDKYFSGNIQLLKGQVDVTLDKPFAYNGNDILVCVNDITKTATDYAVYFEAIEDCNALYASAYKNGEINYVYNPTYTNTNGELDIDQGNADTTISSDKAASIQFTFEGEGGETPEPETPSESITLSVDKESKSIVADGSDLATFTVKHVSGTEETDVTANCTFYQEVGTGGSVINNPFSTTTAGTYTIYAKYQYTSGTETLELESDRITITATEPIVEDIVLSASKTNLEADGIDAVIFTVMQGTNDITSDCEIWYGTEKLNGSTFSTTTVGSYKFYAMYGNLLSNEITINAEHSIYISVDKETIVADGTDYVTFTLTQGTEDITNYTDVTFYVDGAVIDGNTYSTTKAASYQAFAMKGDMYSNTISFTATSPATGTGETVFTPYGSVTYNKGRENEYTLLTEMDLSTGEAVILQDNVYEFTDENHSIYYNRKDVNKPKAETSLTIPAYVLNGETEWLTVTKIEAYAFDDYFDADEEPGNPLNGNFTSLTIPGTIKEISTYTFGFEMTGDIVCYAKTPPALASDCSNNPFLKTVYQNSTLYVFPESIDLYREAVGWGVPFKGGSDYCFKTIVPLTIPTFVAKEDNDWSNANNWRTYIKNATDDNYTEQWGVMPNAGEDVLINGDAVIPAGYTANVGAINIVSGSITVKDGAQLIHTNAGVSVTVEKEIEGYAAREVASTAWHTISSPIAVMTPAVSVSGLLNGAYDLYYYDEPTHYWINHEQETNEFKTLDAGRGYLYANKNDVTLKFNGVINYDNVSFELDATSEYEGLRGFNLIGNPFTHNIHLGANIYSENLNIEGYYSLSKEGQWGVKKASEEAIAPCQGVLVQTNAEETINIVKVAAAPATRSAQPALNIAVANEQYDDNAYVLFKEGQGLNKINHMNENIPMVYVISDNEKFAIANVNDSEEIALGFEAMTMGEYTIAVKAYDCKFNSMTLIDKMTGVKTNLLTDAYTFMATTTDNPNRFTLTLNADNDNDVDNDFIYINNNEMIINNIEGNGLVQIYDVMGRSVATYNVSGSANISMETLSNGVYVVRMTDDNGVKTQKVVNN